MPPAKKPTYLRCKTGFSIPGGQVVRSGSVLDSTDPLVKGRESLFEPIEGAVERATRAPGEMRIVGRPRQKKADD